MRSFCLTALATWLLAVTSAAADEGPFLKSLAGEWTGGGMMKRSTSSSPINLNCSFQSKANGEVFSMNGTCRGMIVVSREVSAQLTATDNQYAGSYIGPSGGVSGLQGKRSGDAINLAVRWSRIINGDRSANMTIQRVNANTIRIQTIDKDPTSGERVITSELNLRRD
ncbi:hypothetical protein [Rhizobium sp. Root1220]|uniref:hypothetical protein n=1 Tax=Rhizobium sp. Root1220 TaxID=1736432 RepID=UPI0006F5D8B1|nr:hypothetical protein [Rhizobium sp. Root1220]KQV65250.1 hypothetical protein ASC90_15330 [Rhizobium sp. Root1220]